MNITERKIAIMLISGVIFSLVIISLLTQYYGSIDIGDYADVSKFFAGEYRADIRSSHSYLLGFIYSPIVKFTKSLIIFKISNLLFLALLIYSAYLISNKNKKVFWLMLLSPVVWYMAPFINPIQIASLIFLWAYYHINKYEKTNRLANLSYGGVLIGLGWAFWDTVLYFGIILGLAYLYNKKTSHAAYFLMLFFVGLLPRMILDLYLFNFPLYTTIKTFISSYINIFGGIYGGSYGHSGIKPVSLILAFLSIPIYFWSMYKPNIFIRHKKAMIFLTLSILLLLTNLQIRYLLTIIPMMVILHMDALDDKKYNIQIIISLIVTFLFVIPYLLQISYDINNSIRGTEIDSILSSGKIDLNKETQGKMISEDLKNIEKKFGNQTFVVGNRPDDYGNLAYYYWGKDIEEFVSIQDYEMWSENRTILFEKRFMPIPNIPDRRQIWIAGGINRNLHDKTEYDKIEYGIGLGEPLKLKNFELIEKYNVLYLSKKIQ